METIDEYTCRALDGLQPGEFDPRAVERLTELEAIFDAQIQSRHLDFAARWLHSRGQGHYTIGSAGHESNAALGLLSRVDDPALLHYRSGGFYAARARVAGQPHPVRDVLLSLTSAIEDPMSGGRHKVFGHPSLHIIPQTSTIGSHLPRAVGLGFSLDLAHRMQRPTPWAPDAVVLCSFGDASANHSTAVGAVNAAAYLGHRNVPCPVLFVCEDNRIGISTPSPEDWPSALLRSVDGVAYWHCDGADPVGTVTATQLALDTVRTSRRPGILHLRTVRFMGHAGSDAEIAYRSRADIEADHRHDPIVATAQTLVSAGLLSAEVARARYEQARTLVMTEAETVLEAKRLDSRTAVMAPLRLPDRVPAVPPAPDRQALWNGRLPEAGAPLTLAQAINATLTDLLAAEDGALVFGEDVAVKGGVYGVTRGLRKRFGGHRVFDTLLDEQTILGTALGAALAGFVPIAEIQYLAYLHNAEDQLRGEAASLRFFSNRQYANGMVVRIAGLAYQRGFGGHFHNDNSLAVLRDIPGIVLAVAATAADAPGILRTCFALARHDGRVCVVVEPIARYHSRDLVAEGDGAGVAAYPPPGTPDTAVGQVGTYGDGTDLLMVTFGNGLPLSLGAARRLQDDGITSTVIDLRWLAPLPTSALLEHARPFDSVLVVDETRASGGVSEAVVTALVDAGFAGRLRRVTSADSFIPLGPAAETVLLGEDDIVNAALALIGR